MHTPPPKTLAINWNPWSRPALKVLSCGHGFLNLPDPSVNVSISSWDLTLDSSMFTFSPGLGPTQCACLHLLDSFSDKSWGPVKCLEMTGRLSLACQHTLTVFFKAQSNYWKSYKAIFVLPKKKKVQIKVNILSNSTHALLFFLVIKINQQQRTADSPVTGLGKGK